MADISVTFVSDQTIYADADPTTTLILGNPTPISNWISDGVISISAFNNQAEFSGQFRSDSVELFYNNTLPLRQTPNIIPQTYITDGILSIGAFNNQAEFGGEFRSDDILQFGNKYITANPTIPNILVTPFSSDSILPFYDYSLTRTQLVVNAGGVAQTPKYYIG